MDNIKVKTNITAVKSIPELADKVDIFITMLPNHKNVSTVCEGDKGLFKLAKKSINLCILLSQTLYFWIAQPSRLLVPSKSQKELQNNHRISLMLLYPVALELLLLEHLPLWLARRLKVIFLL